MLDNPDTAAALDDACRQAGTQVGYLWEVDSGAGRIGNEPGAAAASVIAPVAESTRHAVFAGVMSFAGHAYAAGSPEEIGDIAEGEGRAVLDLPRPLRTQASKRTR